MTDFYDKVLLTLRPTPNLFNTSVATLLIWRPSPPTANHRYYIILLLRLCSVFLSQKWRSLLQK